MVCPVCHTTNLDEAQFCMNCGTALHEDGPLFRGALKGPRAVQAQGERRIISALFCDVVRSTALAERFDPEEWTEIMNRAFTILAGPIERYEGTVARFMGDALLAFFGAPFAHEDDPQRAVFAGLEMLAEIRSFAEQLKKEHGLDFQVRVGINSGPVVVGEVGSGRVAEYTAMGDAVNLAARMEQTAAPGTVQIAEDTYKLVAPIFETEALGPIEIKGKGAPVHAYRVLSAKAHPGRLRGIAGVSAPLVGRDRELERLRAAMKQVKEGRGQVICLIGEAGLGKSRLLEEARKAWLLENPPFTWEQVQGSPYDSARPYGLFQKYARDMFGIQLDDPPDVIHRKVEEGFAYAPPETVAMCKIAMERVIASSAKGDARIFTAEEIKQDLFVIAEKTWRHAAVLPTVCVFDDVHWADPASVELLAHLFKVTDDRPVLFLCAFRPERQSPGWQVKLKAETDYPHIYTEIALQPLGSRQTEDLVSALLNIADLPRDLRQLIVRKAEGNPYFVEEMVRSLIEQGVVYQTEDGLRWKAATKIAEIAIPDSLQALLVARIDRLDAEARATLQLASVIGRTFYLKILKAISDAAAELEKQLALLQRVELVREAIRMPERQYAFKHELARDAAYNTILLRRRRELHRRVGEAIEQLFPDRPEDNAYRLAEHFALAGETRKAYRYYVIAGEVAADLSANAEAASHFAHAIELAADLPDPPPDLAKLRQRRSELAAAVPAPPEADGPRSGSPTG